MLIGKHGRTEAEGVFAAERTGIRAVLHKARAPMLLTIDAPGRALEIETDGLEGPTRRCSNTSPARGNTSCLR
jgi:hypothetical protein